MHDVSPRRASHNGGRPVVLEFLEQLTVGLPSQLLRRGNRHRTDAPLARTSQPLQHRHEEGRRLAAAGRRAREHLAPTEEEGARSESSRSCSDSLRMCKAIGHKLGGP